MWVLFLLPAVSTGFVHRLESGVSFFLYQTFLLSVDFQACTLLIAGILNVLGTEIPLRPVSLVLWVFCFFCFFFK